MADDGYNAFGQCDVDSWNNIVQVAAGQWHTVRLKSDGTVVAVGSNERGQCNTADWNLRPLSSLTSMGTSIQITRTSSNITTNVRAGDAVQFMVNAIAQGGATVHYRFFTRVGYGEPDWAGNRWTIVGDYSPAHSVMVTFDAPGIYFLVCHVEYPGETWEFGDPQSGTAVEVWPVQ